MPQGLSSWPRRKMDEPGNYSPSYGRIQFLRPCEAAVGKVLKSVTIPIRMLPSPAKCRAEMEVTIEEDFSSIKGTAQNESPLHTP